MRPFIPTISLLAAAFLLGCQEQGSAPTSPEAEVRLELLPSIVVVAPSLIEESEVRLVSSDSRSFGYPVALSGDRAIVGYWVDSDFGVEAGAAYVFGFDGLNWNQEAKLFAHDAARGDQFGRAVAIDGDLVVVGSPGADDASDCSFPTCNSGAAYAFRYDGATWVEEAKFLASDGRFLDLFGRAVSVHDDVVVVGALADDNACLDDNTNCNSGAAYVFARTGGSWVEEAKLIPSDAAERKRFGWSLAQHADFVVIGTSGQLEGSAYIFKRTGTSWDQETKLAAPSPAVADDFGRSVSVDGAKMIVGAPNIAANIGVAYVYGSDGTSWTLEATLTASNGTAGDFFGRAVAIHGDLALVGAPSVDGRQIRFGAVYLYALGGTSWSERAIITRASARAGEAFGRALDMEGDVGLIGTNFHGAFVYKLRFSAGEVLQNLITQVIELEFVKGIEAGLTATLNAALASIEADRPAAIAQLNGFIHQIDALRGIHVTDAEADQLIAAANGIIAMIQAAA